MKNSPQIYRQILLLSLVVLMIPMIVFPAQLGTDLASTSTTNFVLELVFYILVAYFFNRKAALTSLIKTAGFCLLYRVTLGATLGLLIVVMYQMNLKAAITLGIFSYIPAILLHISTVPFILKPGVIGWLEEGEEIDSKRVVANVSQEKMGSTSFVATKSRIAISDEPSESPQEKPKTIDYSPKETGETPLIGSDGFDKAVRYVGGDGSVMLAAVIDEDGLLMGNFKRGNFDADDVSPFALPLINRNQQPLQRLGLNHPEKIEFSFENRRVIVAPVEQFTLMVVSERTADDVLNIRINQGLDIIRNYIAERYSGSLIGNAENVYA